MDRIIITALVVVGALIALLFANRRHLKPDIPDVPPGNTDSDPTQPLVDPPEIGFNLNFLASTGASNVPIPDWSGQEISEAFNSLKPRFLRFPGGTVANFYDWRSERLTGSIDSPAAKRAADTRANVTANQAGFLELCRQIGTQPLFVANVYQRDAANGFEWATSLRETAGDPIVRHWELGNELNLYVWHPWFAWSTQLSSVEDYIERAAPLGSLLLDSSDSMLVAANAEGPNYLSDWTESLTDFQGATWNRKLAERSDFYNAISMHIYIFHHPKWQATLGQRAHWLMAAGDELPGELSAWHRSFFGDTPLWLTEFGVSGRDDDEQRLWAFNLAELNAVLNLVAKPGPVTMLLKHLAFSRGTGRVAFRYRVTGRDTRELDWTGNGIGYQWINAALVDAVTVTRADSVSSGSFTGQLRYADRQYPGLFGIEVTSSSGGKILLVINRTEEPIQMTILYDRWTAQILAGKLDTQIIEMPSTVAQLAGDGPTLMSVPPFSLTRIVAS